MTVYYVDLNNGNDDNDGLTPGTAKKTDATIPELTIGDELVVSKYKKVRCKFKCDGVGVYGNCHTAIFSVVTDGSEENKSFFRYTPSGQLSLGVMDKQHFEAGKEYYIDITEVE